MPYVNMKSVPGTTVPNFGIATNFVGSNNSVLFDIGTECHNVTVESARKLHGALGKVLKEADDFARKPKVVNSTLVSFNGYTYLIMGDYVVPENLQNSADLYDNATIVTDVHGHVVKNTTRVS